MAKVIMTKAEERAYSEDFILSNPISWASTEYIRSKNNMLMIKQ